MPLVKELEPGDVFAHEGGVFLVVRDANAEMDSVTCVVLQPLKLRGAVAAFHTTPFNSHIFVTPLTVEDIT